MKVVIVIQARTGSTRLPGKVLLPCADAPVLLRMLERVTAARTAHEVVVATTPAPDDDTIVDIARRAGVDVVRGHPTDCLDRHWAAALHTRADVVVKIPSDCPLIDPDTIDRVIGAYLGWADHSPVDFVSNLHPPTWPDGFDVEVMNRRALELAWREAARPLDREHTTPFLWDNPDRFVVRNVSWETGLDYSERYRLTLDYVEDYELVSDIYNELWSPNRTFSLAEVIELLVEDPELADRNSMYRGTSWYQHHPGALKTLAGALKRRTA